VRAFAVAIILVLAPVAAAADDNTLIVPGVRAGAITLGMSVERVNRLLGKPEEVRPFEGFYFHSYFGRGIALRFDRDRVTTIFLYGGVVGGYEKAKWTGYRGATADGISPRSTLAEVIARLGKPHRSGDLTHAPIPSSWIDYGPIGIHFEFVTANGRQILMSISKPSQE
jgi:hypothetical protein